VKSSATWIPRVLTMDAENADERGYVEIDSERDGERVEG
jgi:hypothetical protein